MVSATGLSVGTLYYVRVAAVNTVGSSAWATASNVTACAAASDRCTTLEVSTADEQSGAPITDLDVSWLGPGTATNSSLQRLAHRLLPRRVVHGRGDVRGAARRRDLGP